MVQKVMVEEEVVEQYQRDGVVLLKNVFDTSWVEKVARGIAKNLEDPSQYSEKITQGDGAYFNDYCNWTKIDEFRDYVYNSPAASLAASFMKTSRVSFYHEHVLNKEPGTTKCTPWHQDQPYYPIDGDKVCSLWMPVDPVPRDTCVSFIPGSHLWSKWFIPRKFATERNYQLLKVPQEGEKTIKEVKSEGRSYYEVPEEDIESGKWPRLQWQCEPGDVIVFHMRTLHGAAGNTSPTTHRRVLSTRWLGEDAVIAGRPWQVSPPVTGDLQPGQPAVCAAFPLVYTRP
ncbi:ectoine dioxygenase-like [Cherax quadricarinatus]|uniref:ectoine dioxygenase-like n=1 Tax=Cherax quadricarinatus TaxID=27406 RepID=UPI00387E3A77